MSDVHNIIAFQLKLDVPSKEPRWCTYRSFRNFDVVNFNMDMESNLSQLNFSEDNDVNDTYEAFTNAILSVTNKHAPLKKKKILPKPVPYMNKTLKQAIYKKECFLTNFKSVETLKIGQWGKFRQQRNLVTKLKSKSINKYFIERCVGGCKSKDFWPTVKPFLTNKGTQVHKDAILFEDNKLINDQQEVCGIFNHFFVNVAKI